MSANTGFRIWYSRIVWFARLLRGAWPWRSPQPIRRAWGLASLMADGFHRHEVYWHPTIHGGTWMIKHAGVERVLAERKDGAT